MAVEANHTYSNHDVKYNLYFVTPAAVPYNDIKIVGVQSRNKCSLGNVDRA
jgi:hypothetical protein